MIQYTKQRKHFASKRPVEAPVIQEAVFYEVFTQLIKT